MASLQKIRAAINALLDNLVEALESSDLTFRRRGPDPVLCILEKATTLDGLTQQLRPEEKSIFATVLKDGRQHAVMVWDRDAKLAAIWTKSGYILPLETVFEMATLGAVVFSAVTYPDAR